LGANKQVFDLTAEDKRVIFGGTTESGTGTKNTSVRAADGGIGKDAADRQMVTEVMGGTGGQ